MRESSSHFEPRKWLSASPKTLLSAGRLRYFKNQTFTTYFHLFFLFICKNLGAGAIHLPRAFEIPKGGGRLRPPEPKKKDTLKRVFLFGGDTQIRTGGGAFAELCLTTWLCRRMDKRKRCFLLSFLEQVTRLELATSTLARWRSTR